MWSWLEVILSILVSLKVLITYICRKIRSTFLVSDNDNQIFRLACDFFGVSHEISTKRMLIIPYNFKKSKHKVSFLFPLLSGLQHLFHQFEINDSYYLCQFTSLLAKLCSKNFFCRFSFRLFEILQSIIYLIFTMSSM